MVSINWMVYDFICADATRWGGLHDLMARGGYGFARRYRREGMLALPYGLRRFYG